MFSKWELNKDAHNFSLPTWNTQCEMLISKLLLLSVKLENLENKSSSTIILPQTGINIIDCLLLKTLELTEIWAF